MNPGSSQTVIVMPELKLAKVIDIKAKENRSIEASDWIAKLDRGLSIAETSELRRWMADDPEAAATLNAMAGMWDKMDSMARLSELFPHEMLEPDAPITSYRWVAMAASVVVAVLVGFGTVSYLSDSQNDDRAALVASEVGVYETAVGGLSRIQLSDGSQLTLNTNSRLEVEFTQANRIIRLRRGEFHIDVAHDISRPLSVIAGGRVVQAVGTAFTVKIDEDQRVELLVIDGRVKVGIATIGVGPVSENYLGDVDDMALYSKGDRIMLDATNDELQALRPDEIEIELSWRDGNLVFNGLSLGEAIAEISRYTTVKFVFVDEDLQDVRVAGLFKAGDVSGFLTSLRANFDISYEHVDSDTVQLSAL